MRPAGATACAHLVRGGAQHALEVADTPHVPVVVRVDVRVPEALQACRAAPIVPQLADVHDQRVLHVLVVGVVEVADVVADLLMVLPRLAHVLLALAPLALQVRIARAVDGAVRPRQRVLEGVGVVRNSSARLQLGVEVLVRDVVEGVAQQLRAAVALLLPAHEVHERRKGRGEGGVMLVPTEVVRAESDEDELAVVELVLAIDVEHELERHAQQLQHPSNLYGPCEALPMHCIVAPAQWNGHSRPEFRQRDDHVLNAALALD